MDVLGEKVETAEEITGTDIPEQQIKSILIDVMDPITRQHTALQQGVETTYRILRDVVLQLFKQKKCSQCVTAKNASNGP